MCNVSLGGLPLASIILPPSLPHPCTFYSIVRTSVGKLEKNRLRVSCIP